MNFIKCASLVLINSIKQNLSELNYNLLVLRRIASTQSFAGKIVFPGGTLDQCDYSDKWQSIIDKQFSKSQLESLGGSNLPIYGDSRAFPTALRPEIFYRICAIRETFEETGILLARDGSNKSVISDGKLLQDIKLHDWQGKVARQSDLFLDMCTAYNIAPDLPALKEWAEWLSPAVFKRRFLVVFFLAVIHGALATSINRSEYEDFFWKTPKNVSDSYLENNELVPPQVNELFDLSLLASWQQVESEAARRNLHRIKRNIGIIFNLSNGRIFLFSGDSRFLPEMEVQDIEFTFPDKTVEDFQADRWKRRIITQNNRIRFENNRHSDISD